MSVWLIDWLDVCLCDWLIDWLLIDWLIDWMIDWRIFRIIDKTHFRSLLWGVDLIFLFLSQITEYENRIRAYSTPDKVFRLLYVWWWKTPLFFHCMQQIEMSDSCWCSFWQTVSSLIRLLQRHVEDSWWRRWGLRNLHVSFGIFLFYSENSLLWTNLQSSGSFLSKSKKSLKNLRQMFQFPGLRMTLCVPSRRVCASQKALAWTISRHLIPRYAFSPELFLQSFVSRDLSPKLFLQSSFSKALSPKLFLQSSFFRALSPKLFLQSSFSRALSPELFLQSSFPRALSSELFHQSSFSKALSPELFPQSSFFRALSPELFLQSFSP